MTIYQSPWARNFRRMRMYRAWSSTAASVICAALTMTIMMYMLIRCVEHEATIAEQQRIYRMLGDNHKGMSLYIAEMEKAGRGQNGR